MKIKKILTCCCLLTMALTQIVLVSKAAVIKWDPKTGKSSIFNPLYHVVEHSNVEDLKDILNRGTYDVNEQLKERKNATVLFCAAKGGSIEKVETLLDYGADPNIKNSQNMTSLHVAAEGGHNKVVLALLPRIADVDVPGSNGLTALHLVSKTCNLEVAKSLKLYSAKIDAKSVYGFTPLMFAAMYGCKDVLIFLADNGADINAQDNYSGSTALHEAVANDRQSIVRLLVEKYGADSSIKNNEGDTPQDLAKSSRKDQGSLSGVISNGFYYIVLPVAVIVVIKKIVRICPRIR